MECRNHTLSIKNACVVDPFCGGGEHCSPHRGPPCEDSTAQHCHPTKRNSLPLCLQNKMSQRPSLRDRAVGLRQLCCSPALSAREGRRSATDTHFVSQNKVARQTLQCKGRRSAKAQHFVYKTKWCDSSRKARAFESGLSRQRAIEAQR